MLETDGHSVNTKTQMKPHTNHYKSLQYESRLCQLCLELQFKYYAPEVNNKI
jgi:hypothetical protein